MRATILVIDDDECMRELLRLQLERAGYSVLLAEDAVTAGHIVVEHRPDLIISDVEMPYMDGFEFVRALRADPDVCATPIIFLTSLERYEQAQELGAAAYLSKPVALDHVLREVAKHAYPR